MKTETKLFSALPPELIMKIHALTKNYEDLKETVIKNYKEPNWGWVEKLINDTRMIGQPFYYLRELMATAYKVRVREDLVKLCFTQAEPPAITSVIAAIRNLTLGKLGTLANELIPFMSTDMVQNTTYAEHYRR